MKLLYAIIIIWALGSCYPNKPVYEHKGPYLYYKIVGIKIELMKRDTITGNQVTLDTVSILKNGQEIFYKIKFKLKPNTEAERGNYPSQAFTKCSKEKINNFSVKLQAPNNDILELNPTLQGLDSTKHYKRKPFLRFYMIWYNFRDVPDFVSKFNNCHPYVQRGLFLEHGLILSGVIPITQVGKHTITIEINFSDNRTVKGELKVNGKMN